MSGSFEFLEPSGAAIARSPMEGQAIAAGAQMEVRDGWNVAVSYPTNGSVTWTDMSHLRKREVHGAHELTPGVASKTDGAWWCPVTRDRALVIGDSDATPPRPASQEEVTDGDHPPLPRHSRHHKLRRHPRRPGHRRRAYSDSHLQSSPARLCRSAGRQARLCGEAARRLS